MQIRSVTSFRLPRIIDDVSNLTELVMRLRLLADVLDDAVGKGWRMHGRTLVGDVLEIQAPDGTPEPLLKISSATFEYQLDPDAFLHGDQTA